MQSCCRLLTKTPKLGTYLSMILPTVEEADELMCVSWKRD